jgi:hypothetical protein
MRIPRPNAAEWSADRKLGGGAAPFLGRDVRAGDAAEVNRGPAGAAGLSAAIVD